MMTCVVGRRLVVFSQVSAVVSCWVVRRLVVRDGAFARILHASKGRLARAVPRDSAGRTRGSVVESRPERRIGRDRVQPSSATRPQHPH